MTDEQTKLKRLHPLNDYVAVMRTIEMPDGIEIPAESMEKMSNEGVVVGVGPGYDDIKVGDVVVFQPKARKLAISPESGCYGGKTIVLMHSADLVLKVKHSDKYSFVEEE